MLRCYASLRPIINRSLTTLIESTTTYCMQICSSGNLGVFFSTILKSSIFCANPKQENPPELIPAGRLISVKPQYAAKDSAEADLNVLTLAPHRRTDQAKAHQHHHPGSWFWNCATDIGSGKGNLHRTVSERCPLLCRSTC